MVGQLNTSLVNVFKSEFENRCLRLIFQAYQSARSNMSVLSNFDEEDITEVLNCYLDDNQQRIDWNIFTNTENRLRDKKVTRVKGFAKKASRIDLRFATINSSIDYRYYMEAKNLKHDSAKLKRRYIKTGIDNFIKKKYNDGFIAGYLLSGDIANNIDGLNKLLLKDNRTTESIPLSPQNNSGYNYYVSDHTTIQIKHVFFDFN